jgi:ribosomal protein L37AE/L43A
MELAKLKKKVTPMDPHKAATCAECGQTGLFPRADGLTECGSCGHIFAGKPTPGDKKKPGKFVVRKLRG